MNSKHARNCPNSGETHNAVGLSCISFVAKLPIQGFSSDFGVKIKALLQINKERQLTPV
jgi:hypothetical protein